MLQAAYYQRFAMIIRQCGGVEEMVEIRSDDRPDGHEGRPCKWMVAAHVMLSFSLCSRVESGFVIYWYTGRYRLWPFGILKQAILERENDR